MLTSQQKLKIIELDKNGLSGRKIAEELKVSYKAVRNVLERDPDPTPRSLTFTGPNPSPSKPPQSESEVEAGEEPQSQLFALPPENPYDVAKGIEWMQAQVKVLYLETSDVRGRLFVLDQMRQLNAQVIAQLESIYNMQLLNAFINQVTAILERHDPQVREIIYRELESCGMANGAIGVVFDSSGGSK